MPNVLSNNIFKNFCSSQILGVFCCIRPMLRRLLRSFATKRNTDKEIRHNPQSYTDYFTCLSPSCQIISFAPREQKERPAKYSAKRSFPKMQNQKPYKVIKGISKNLLYTSSRRLRRHPPPSSVSLIFAKHFFYFVKISGFQQRQLQQYSRLLRRKSAAVDKTCVNV